MIFHQVFFLCVNFKSSQLFQVLYPRGTARGLMAGVAQRDVETISNQSGDTFLLSDVDTDFPSVEEPAVLPSALPVSESSNGPVSNVSYAAVTAASTPAAAPRVQESRPYRNEIFLSSFERANFHPDNVTPERPCTAYFQASVFADSTAVFDALKTQGFAASSVRCLQRRPTGEMLITFSSAHMKKAFVEKNSIEISHRRYAINDSDRFLTYLNIYDAPHEFGAVVQTPNSDSCVDGPNSNSAVNVVNSKDSCIIDNEDINDNVYETSSEGLLSEEESSDNDSENASDNEMESSENVVHSANMEVESKKLLSVNIVSPEYSLCGLSASPKIQPPRSKLPVAMGRSSRSSASPRIPKASGAGVSKSPSSRSPGLSEGLRRAAQDWSVLSKRRK